MTFLSPNQFKNNPPHPGSVELFERIGTWHNFPLPFSVEFGWERWGLFVLFDYVLHYVHGDMVEIGIGESSIYFTRLARKYHRKVYHCDIQKSDFENLCTVPDFFDSSNILYLGASDDFFREVDPKNIALGFIDGDHLYPQVKKDFDNLFRVLVPNGFIFIHDLYPPNEEFLVESRCGTGYLFRQELERRVDLEVFTFPFSAWNVGLTMVRKLPEDLPYFRNKVVRR